MAAWWGVKTRQFVRHLTGRVTDAERRELAAWLTPAQLQLFESMHPADQRHGLDVVQSLRRGGRDERELLLAGLLHDCAKGRAVGVWHRVGWSLGERYGPRVRRLLARLPGFAEAFERIRSHPQRSAELALAAGCGGGVAELIRRQDEVLDEPMHRALRLADEAN